MNKSCGTFWGMVAVLLVALLLADGPAQARRVVDQPGEPASGRAGNGLDVVDPDATRSMIMHDIGNVRMALANWGEMGNPDGIPGFKGFEFPINTGSDFLFSAGIWVGAQVNGQRLVSTTTDGDNGTNEFYPVHVGTVPFSRVARNADWYVTSKSLATFNDLAYIQGAKGLDDDGDWTAADDRNGDGRASADFDGDSLDANGDGNPAYDPEPHVDEDPAGDISNDYLDNDFDGLVDLADPDNDGDQNIGFADDDNDGAEDEDGVARGGQEYYTVFHDDIPLTFVGSPDNDGHSPLHIQMLQRSYAFAEAYASEFILIDYRIRNVGVLPLDNVYIAMFSDPDIGAAGEGGDAASLDDFNYYDPARLMMIQYDNVADNDGPGPGIFAIRVVQTPVALEDLKVAFRNFERVAGGDPENNAAKYDMISSGTVSPATTQQGDWRMLFGFGAQATDGFRLGAGEELPITVALIAGEDTTQGGVNAEWARRMYENDFQGPSAPNTPEFDLDIYADRVRIRWSPNAETSIDAITNEADFEGYIIERSLDQINWETIAAFDSINPGSLELPFEWENFNLGMPTDTLWDADHTTFQYVVWDENLIPGHTYYYVVRAFDRGVAGAGVLYSGRTGNVQTALIARNAETYGSELTRAQKLELVYVFPNPYRGSHAGEQGGQINPSKGLIEYPRKLYFMGLPPNTQAGNCEIRIYSLGGDHLATIDHVNGTEYDQWDMITGNQQEIVAGIYYYVVKYGSEQVIDKFVVIK